MMKRTDDNKKTNVEESKRKTQPTLLEDILQLIYKIIFICIIFMLLFIFLFGIHRVTEQSMAPAVKDGDLVVLYRLDKNYKAGDIIAFEVNGTKQVRRVVAVGGDEVNITDDGLLVNGYLQQGIEDNYIAEKTLRYEEGIDFPLTLQEDEVFVLGDSREHSTDSRIYGPIKVKDSLGKLMLILRRRNF